MPFQRRSYRVGFRGDDYNRIDEVDAGKARGFVHVQGGENAADNVIGAIDQAIDNFIIDNVHTVVCEQHKAGPLAPTVWTYTASIAALGLSGGGTSTSAALGELLMAIVESGSAPVIIDRIVMKKV